MADKKITRREVIKKAVYVTPVILTLAAKPSFARTGSPRVISAKSGKDSKGKSSSSKYSKGKYSSRKDSKGKNSSFHGPDETRKVKGNWRKVKYSSGKGGKRG